MASKLSPRVMVTGADVALVIAMSLSVMRAHPVATTSSMITTVDPDVATATAFASDANGAAASPVPVASSPVDDTYKVVRASVPASASSGVLACSLAAKASGWGADASSVASGSSPALSSAVAA